MDAGTVVAWPQRHNDDELSAIQHAMNLKFRDEAAFFSEYQNQPLPDSAGDVELLTADQVAEKVNGRKHGEIPTGCNHVTMFIDVHDHLLFYVVAAWEDDFTGYVVNYGAYPDQRRQFFTLRDARSTLGRAAPGAGKEGAIRAGLTALTDDYLSREWRRDDGAVMQIDRCLIDKGYVPDVVEQCVRAGGRSAVVMPAKGVGIRAADKPFSEYHRKRGDQNGFHWRIPGVGGTRELRAVHIDTNFWKSFCQARLAVALGDRGCLSLFGTPSDHRLFAEHVTAEFRVKTEGRGRTVDDWKLKSGAVDNHWLDCVVGCAVAVSVQGVSLPGMDVGTGSRRKRYTQADLQRRP
jgi:phage terminase large subunit GpA-like protein